MPKKRVHEIAKEQGVSSKDLLARLKEAGIDASAPASTVDEGAALQALGGNGAAAGNGAPAPAAERPAPPAPPTAERPQRPARPAAGPERPQRPVRPAGDRPQRPVRPAGDRPQRPVRPAGERPQRPAGDRPQRPAGDRPARPARASGAPSAPRPAGGDAPRPARAPGAPRPARASGAPRAPVRAEQPRPQPVRLPPEAQPKKPAKPEPEAPKPARRTVEVKGPEIVQRAPRPGEPGYQPAPGAGRIDRADAERIESATDRQPQRGGPQGRRSGPGAPSRHSGGPSAPPSPPAKGGPRPAAADGGSGRRRVVIDSQAARRQDGPGGGKPPPGPQRPPRRGGRRRRRSYEDTFAEHLVERTEEEAPRVEVIRVNSGSTVKDVAEYLDVPVPEIIKKLMTMGEMATLTQTLGDDAIELIATEFDREVEIVHAADEVEEEDLPEDDEASLVERPPVVTIMGHVDHGKTSLLDAIRETEVAAGEAGGITQHIGAYQVHHDDKLVTFLDTPGHQAFTAMRARGAKVTDIAVIVVAADDGVKPQTEEAIDHAKAAGVPILVAVNKIDKEGAQPDRVRTEMTQHGLQPVDWGGETEFVDVSAKTKDGLDDLLATLLVMAEVEELKANPDTEASGVVVESKLDPGRGPVVTVLVQRGTLRVGDALVAGSHWGRVRAMHDFLGERRKEAGPGEPIEVLGFDGVPEAGETVRVVENDRRARQLANERATRLKAEAIARRQSRKVSLEDLFSQVQAGRVQELGLVLKADVAGSLEAIEDEIAKLPQSEVAVNVIHSGVGGVNESDVMLAAASEGIVMGFNVRPVGDARAVADREGVEIRSYSVIYKAMEELRAAMEGMLEPEEVEETVGRLEVRATFKASRIGTIAGCYVTDGKVTRGARARLVRDGTVVYDGSIASLRRFNEDAREVAQGYECGVVLRDYADVKDGDEIEVYATRQVERELA